MKAAIAIGRLLPVTACLALFAMSALAGQGGTAAQEGASESSPLRGSGLLIIDRRDSPAQITAGIRRFFSVEEGHVALSQARRTEIARRVNAVFAVDEATSNELPLVFFEFRPRATVELFRASLLSSESARKSDEVCPEDCPFRDLDESSLHFHLTAPTGSGGDTVLVLRIREPFDSAARDRRECPCSACG